MRNTHEIHNYFHSNRLNTRLICNICEANYDLKSNLTNLKNYFEKYHNDEYQKIIEKNKERQKEIRKQNQITRQEKEKSRIEEKKKNNSIDLIFNDVNIKINGKYTLNFK